MPDSIDFATPRPLLPLLEPAHYKGAYGGRAAMKSHFFAGLAIERSLLDKCDIVCVREVQQSLKWSVKKLLEEKIAALGAAAYFRVLDDRIESANRGVMIFTGMNTQTNESIKSLEAFDVAWVEEAQTLSQRSLELLTPTIRKASSEIWFSWNPRFPSDPVDALLRGKHPPPSSIVVATSYRDNPWLSAESLAEANYARERDPELYAHVWLGEYETHSEARVFKNWTIEEFDRPAGTIYRLGADWGYAVDPSVLVRCSIEGNRLYVDHEAYMVGCEIVHLPHLFARVPESEKWGITADSARPETISYMRAHGYPKINGAIKGAKSLEEGIAFLQSFDIVVHPRCQHVIDELTLYRYRRDPLTNEVLPLLEDKDNHCIDALRYACEGARRAKPEVRRIEPPRIPRGAGAWQAM